MKRKAEELKDVFISRRVNSLGQQRKLLGQNFGSNKVSCNTTLTKIFKGSSSLFT